MELKFDNKKTEKQVLSNANKVKNDFEIDNNNSMLFKEDNFEALSIFFKKLPNLLNNCCNCCC